MTGIFGRFGMSYDEAIAIIAAARAYFEWARETGDYPHDETGCRAHEALVAAVRAMDEGD
jgi:hypothetical protein